MTNIPGPIQPIHEDVRARLEALKAGREATGTVVLDEVRAAIHAGHIGQVCIFCDACGVEYEGDYIGATREERFAAARAYLATQGWDITLDHDHCPKCQEP